MNKILSVIVPSYNMEAYLPKSLGSLVVAPELMERLEVLVVNDGSKDRTSEIAHGFAAKWPGTFKVIDKANGNYGSCINAALPLATGTYVRVLDADDYADTEAFAASLEVLNREVEKGAEGIDLLVTGYDEVNEDGKLSATHDYRIGAEGVRTLDEVPEDSLRFSVQSVAYRTENLRRIRYRQTEGVSYTDTEWVIEPMVTVRKFYYFPRVVVHYLFGRAGQTGEAATFVKRFRQVVDITEGILGRYARLHKIAFPAAVGYYERQIGRLVEAVYRARMFGVWDRPVSFDLEAFDRLLSDCPNFYGAAGSYRIVTRWFSFHYVSEWRRKHSRKTFKFFLFDCYKLLVRCQLWIKDMLFRVVRQPCDCK